ncbi:YciI family protein [Kordiimonas sp. SCSIO 12610]|uniref:YciI family protein n=1 Tax=Kordiimonas sp. SCSIO 12610 TaxID=2829597 RepID=UPI0021090667|nr:YciI family protein [Kordiimonas sp. SCSIO 12610]UTW54932.1 hypothetical protein KFF44_14160 [Kordiimonas sp. SCSIO 12610]
MSNFALLLNHKPDRYDNLSDAKMMDIVKDYIAWIEKLTAEGIYQAGEKLIPAAGKTLTKSSGNIEVHDSPFTELKEVLGGFMIIKADDYNHAIETAKSCPHLVHNESLEIRQIHDVD